RIADLHRHVPLARDITGLDGDGKLGRRGHRDSAGLATDNGGGATDEAGTGDGEGEGGAAGGDAGRGEGRQIRRWTDIGDGDGGTGGHPCVGVAEEEADLVLAEGGGQGEGPGLRGGAGQAAEEGVLDIGRVRGADGGEGDPVIGIAREI